MGTRPYYNPLYVFEYAKTLKGSLIDQAGKTTFNFVSVGKLSNMLIPLPPFAEQKRIVAKIEELLPYIDRYEQAWSKLEKFNKRFPVDMQKSILQTAIELKLKKYELDEKEKQACVEARIIHEIKNRYKIKVWNSGNSIAKNVVASWDTQKGIIFFDKEKMPFEVLEPQKGFELVITTYDGNPGKLQIKTEWENDNGEKKEKLQWCDM